MSEKPKFIIQEELILNEIPQRGEPPYFVHSGFSGWTASTLGVHGAIHNDWITALARIQELSGLVKSSRNQQILSNMPISVAAYSMDELNEFIQNGHLVFDRTNPDDELLLMNLPPYLSDQIKLV